ncbi:MAG: nucleotidyltransferase [Planctomycetaceae bacterium]|jgi:hypothetical protein|nr:nucleotidyltransferase [Planctomycetaceae bacterium]
MFIETQKINTILKNIASQLDIPPSKYEQAVERYKSVGKWLDAYNSNLKPDCSEIFPQGSFRLGTVVRPWNDGKESDYDIDLVCKLDADKFQNDPKKLKHIVGKRLKEYSDKYSKDKQLLDEEGRRCWTLEYAEEDGIGFHMDILPSLSANEAIVAGIVSHGVDAQLAKNAISITDTEDKKTYKWQSSNPEGYALWFDKRCQVLQNYNSFQKTAKASIFNSNQEVYASVAEVPDQMVRTPLQQVIQILKRYRDVYFAHKRNEEHKPISMIITTLAALCYSGESDVLSALTNIVLGIKEHSTLLDDNYSMLSNARFNRLIYRENRVWYINNPVNPQENFADRWHNDNNAKAKAFFNWVDSLSNLFSLKFFKNTKVEDELNNILLKAVFPKNSIIDGPRSFFDVPHRQIPKWSMQLNSNVCVLVTGKWTKSGFRPILITVNNSPVLEKYGDIVFNAETNVLKPYIAYWQVVNTGDEALRKGCLRGEFNEEPCNNLQHKERTEYTGRHWVECFIVKDNVCVAKSGEFVINIK